MEKIVMNHTMPWNEFENKMKQVFGNCFKRVDELYFNVVKEVKLGEREYLEDSQALKYLQDLHDMTGKLCVITDLCYIKKCGPFIMNANAINNFVDTFSLMYGEPFYSTDIIIVNFEEKLIWVLFHEGICWLSKG